MSYTKTTWKNGDVITADKLNNIENGIDLISQNHSGDSENNPFYIVNITGEGNPYSNWNGTVTNIQTDKTYQQVKQAIDNNKIVILNVTILFDDGEGGISYDQYAALFRGTTIYIKRSPQDFYFIRWHPSEITIRCLEENSSTQT